MCNIAKMILGVLAEILGIYQYYPNHKNVENTKKVIDECFWINIS
jgi:hypothetical protein